MRNPSEGLMLDRDFKRYCLIAKVASSRLQQIMLMQNIDRLERLPKVFPLHVVNV